MYFSTAFLAAVITYGPVITAHHTKEHNTCTSCPIQTPCSSPSPTSASPPPGQTFTTSYPICAIAGYTAVPGPYIETIHQSSNSTVRECVRACVAAPGCESIAFAEVYEECLFFDRMVRNLQFLEEGGSYFVHWDLGCFNQNGGGGARK